MNSTENMPEADRRLLAQTLLHIQAFSTTLCKEVQETKDIAPAKMLINNMKLLFKLEEYIESLLNPSEKMIYDMSTIGLAIMMDEIDPIMINLTEKLDNEE